MTNGALATDSPSVSEVPHIAKCGAGSSKQTIVQGDSIVSFCYTWENAETVEFNGLPSSLDIAIDNSAKQVWITGIASNEPGVYAYTVTTVGGIGDAYLRVEPLRLPMQTETIQ